MNKTFCSALRHKNIYEVTQPKFCAGCGAGMGVKASVSGVDKVLRPQVEIESEDRVGGFDLERMRREVVAEANTNKIKLTDIMGSSSGGGGDFVRDAANLPDGEELIEKNQQDCSSSKPTDIDGQ